MQGDALRQHEAGTEAAKPRHPDASTVESEDPVADAAFKRFGVRPRPWQRLVMANILDSGAESDAPLRQIVVLPTGAGKSLCFQVPALLHGLTLVVYPLLALMTDQSHRLSELGIPHALIRGGMEPGERENALKKVESGEARLVLTNPESLASPALLERLARAGVAHVAVDEAHCVAEWGDSFRPAYLELGERLASLKAVAVTAFTATASPPVLERVAQVLFRGESWRLLSGDPDRPNIAYRVEPTLSKMHTLERLIGEREGPLICFCASRDGARLVAEALVPRLGRDRVRYYHAGLDRDEKEAVERSFMPSKTGILVATVAFGMGVDKSDIRTVVHWDPPGSVEAYLQESGRAGRDGRSALAVLLMGENERPRGAEASSRARAEALLAWAADGAVCRREGLMRLLGDEKAGERACGACDVCEGKARLEPEGIAPLLAFVERNTGRFDRAQALAHLLGNAETRSPGYGCLRAWDAHDLGELLDAALRRGMLRQGRGARLRRVWPYSSGKSSSSGTGAATGAGLLGFLSARLCGALRGFR